VYRARPALSRTRAGMLPTLAAGTCVPGPRPSPRALGAGAAPALPPAAHTRTLAPEGSRSVPPPPPPCQAPPPPGELDRGKGVLPSSIGSPSGMTFLIEKEKGAPPPTPLSGACSPGLDWHLRMVSSESVPV